MKLDFLVLINDLSQWFKKKKFQFHVLNETNGLESAVAYEIR